MNHLELTTESKSTSDSIMRFYVWSAVFTRLKLRDDVPDCFLLTTLDRIRLMRRRR